MKGLESMNSSIAVFLAKFFLRCKEKGLLFKLLDMEPNILLYNLEMNFHLFLRFFSARASRSEDVASTFIETCRSR
jgi:anti-anti-sigma regulatory factor